MSLRSGKLPFLAAKMSFFTIRGCITAMTGLLESAAGKLSFVWPTTEVSPHSAGYEGVPRVWPFNATEKLDPDIRELLSMHCSWCVLDCGEAHTELSAPQMLHSNPGSSRRVELLDGALDPIACAIGRHRVHRIVVRRPRRKAIHAHAKNCVWMVLV